MKLKKDIIHLIASFITISVFLFGYYSLPEIFSQENSNEANSLVGSFDSVITVSLILIGFPLFNFIDTWMIISLMRLIVTFLHLVGINVCETKKRSYIKFGNVIYIEPGTPIEFNFYVIGVLALLPVVIGLNLLFVEVIFGGFTSFWSYVMFICSILITAYYYWIWIFEWRAPIEWYEP